MSKQYTIEVNDSDAAVITWIVGEAPAFFMRSVGLEVAEDLTEEQIVQLAFEHLVLPQWIAYKSQFDASVLQQAFVGVDAETVNLTHQAIAAIQTLSPEEQKAALQQIVDMKKDKANG